MFIDADMARSSFAISEKAGLESGSDDQHRSINDLHVGSHQLGISGRRLPLIMPAEKNQIESRHKSMRCKRTCIQFSCD